MNAYKSIKKQTLNIQGKIMRFLTKKEIQMTSQKLLKYAQLTNNYGLTKKI